MKELKEIAQYKLLKDIKKLSNVQTNLFNIESEKFGLTSGEYSFLFSILNNPGMTLKELSKDLVSDKSITTKAVNKLLKNNFIEKKENLEDKRSYKLYFNENKIEFIDSLKDIAIDYSNILLKGFSEEEKILFEDFLNRSFINISKKY